MSDHHSYAQACRFFTEPVKQTMDCLVSEEKSRTEDLVDPKQVRQGIFNRINEIWKQWVENGRNQDWSHFLDWTYTDSWRPFLSGMGSHCWSSIKILLQPVPATISKGPSPKGTASRCLGLRPSSQFEVVSGISTIVRFRFEMRFQIKDMIAQYERLFYFWSYTNAGYVNCQESRSKTRIAFKSIILKYKEKHRLAAELLSYNLIINSLNEAYIMLVDNNL